VADGSFSAVDPLRAIARHLRMVTRLRLDAGLYEPAPARAPGTVGRPRVEGARAEPGGAEPGPGHALAAGDARGRGRAPAGRRLRRRGPASPRHAGADPPGAGARRGRRAGAASLPVHRPGGRAGHHPRPVRAPPAPRDDVRGGAPPPRGGDAAAMVGAGHPADHARAARPALAGGRPGGRDPGPVRPAARGRLPVPQANADLQRCPCRCQSGTLARGGFHHITARPAGQENSRRPP
jgi:hypothetical protein